MCFGLWAWNPKSKAFSAGLLARLSAKYVEKRNRKTTPKTGSQASLHWAGGMKKEVPQISFVEFLVRRLSTQIAEEERDSGGDF